MFFLSNPTFAIFIIFAFLGIQNLQAAVKIEITNDSNEETIWANDTELHVKNMSSPVYTLINTTQRKLYTVDLDQKVIIDLSEKIKEKLSISEVNDISIEFVHHGAGPVMLGFDTDLYLLKVNGEICRTEYLSQSAKELNVFIAGLELMTEYRISTTFSNLPSDLDLCFVADHLSFQRYSQYGFPMKSSDQYGKVTFELLSINTASSNPPGNFKVPVARNN